MSPRTEYESQSTFTSWETLAKRPSSSKAGPLFTLSKGRGRFGRPRPKPVRGLPGTRPRVTQTSLLGERVGLRRPPGYAPGLRIVFPWERAE